MKEHPILFSSAMVKAILAGTKTQTRRVIKRLPCQCYDVAAFDPQEMSARTPEGHQTTGHSGRWWCRACTSDQDAVNCPLGAPGDRLWCKENFKYVEDLHPEKCCTIIEYQADGSRCNAGWADDAGNTLKQVERDRKRWRPSIFMPRWASRITLEVTGVRVERLQDISEEDAKAEGVSSEWLKTAAGREGLVPVFMQLWRSINGPKSWESNPFVWAISFRRI
jgi:hypothetical protein